MATMQPGGTAHRLDKILSLWIWALPVLLLVAWLSLRQIDLYPAEVDEFYSMYNVGWVSNGPYSPIDVLQSLEQNSPNHTPAYFLLLNLWGHIVGNEVALARILTIFTGLLSLTLMYRLARDFVGPAAGTLRAAHSRQQHIYPLLLWPTRACIPC